jgi:hypothetical protein
MSAEHRFGDVPLFGLVQFAARRDVRRDQPESIVLGESGVAVADRDERAGRHEMLGVQLSSPQKVIAVIIQTKCSTTGPRAPIVGTGGPLFAGSRAGRPCP